MEEPSQVRAQMAGCQNREFFAKGFRRSSGTEPHSSGQMSWGFWALTTHCKATAEAAVREQGLCVDMGPQYSEAFAARKRLLARSGGRWRALGWRGLWRHQHGALPHQQFGQPGDDPRCLGH